MKPSIAKFSLEEAQAAADAWGFNCGPGALAAVLDAKPEDVRHLIPGFAEKGYTNPSMMTDALRAAGKHFRPAWRMDEPCDEVIMPRLKHGLVRVQWGGPWTKPGVPMAARYGHTHWVAVRTGLFYKSEAFEFHLTEVFDINAIRYGGWIHLSEWEKTLVPWLCKECHPKWDGRWWPTHAYEVAPPWPPVQ